MSTVAHRRQVPVLTIFLGLVLFGLTLALAYRGWAFYQLPLDERPYSPDKTLRPTGFLGNGYGWVAALLVIMNLSYLLRRRLANSSLGSMKAWLDVHVFTGLLASVLVSFHSAFQLRSPVATTSAASLGVVVLTGLIGRFLYALTPAADRKRLRDALDDMEAVWTGHRAELVATLDEIPGPTVPQNASLLRSVLAIPGWRRASKARRRALTAMLPPRREQDQLMREAAKELYGAASAEARSSGMSALLRSWRGLHRFFALLMLAAVLLHAGAAWYFGYRWIFA